MKRFVQRALAAAIAIGTTIALVPLQAVPVAAAAPTESKPTRLSDLKPLKSDDPAEVKTEHVKGDFSKLPPAHGLGELAGKKPAAVDHFNAQTSKLIAQEADRDIFDNGDGTETVQISPRPINVRDADGKWQKIDDTLRKDDKNRVRNGAGYLQASLAAESGTGSLVELKGPKGSLSFELEGAKSKKVGKLAENTITYPDVLDETDLTYRVSGDQIKETIVVKEKSAVAPLYRFPVKAKDLAAKKLEDGTVNYVNKKGEVAFHVQRGIAWDSAEQPTTSFFDVALSADGKALELRPDPLWLESATYPVSIDPTIDLGLTVASYDAYTQSNQPTWNYNNAGQFDGTVYVNRAGVWPGVTEWNSHMYFDTAGLNGKQILHASFNPFVYSEENGSAPLCIYPASSGWQQSLVNWNTRPGHFGNCNVPSDPDKIRAAPNLGSYNGFDVTTWVGQWTSGARVNHGMTMDTAGQNGHFRIGAFEMHTMGGQGPYMRVTYNTLPDISQPLSPANETPVLTDQPTLTSTPVTDPDADTVQYQYRVSNTDDPDVGQVINSGVQYSPSWQVPEGALVDGTTYSWRVMINDNVSPYGAYRVSPTFKFRVNKRLGQQSVSPMDTSGAASVNMATGNVTTGTSSPMFPTVGGEIGLSYAYNSQDQRETGLTGRYYDNCGPNGTFPAEPRTTKRDAVMNMNWWIYSPAPAVAHDNFCVKWNGFVTVPHTGFWCFDATGDDGVRLWVNGKPIRNRWQQGSVTTPSAAYPDQCTQILNSLTVKIEMEYFENTGGAHVGLWSAPVEQIDQMQPTPSSWLTTTAGSMPNGWKMSVASDIGIAYSRARISEQAVVLIEPDGQTHEYRRTAADLAHAGVRGFTTPADERTTLSQRPDGTLQAEGEDGLLYEFDGLGQLTKVMSAQDDLKPAAATYTYETNVVTNSGRLTEMTDPVTNRRILLKYGARSQATPECMSAPIGYLCRVEYWDSSYTTLTYTTGEQSAQLARITDWGPGGQLPEITDFGYANVDIDPSAAVNNQLLMTQIQDALSNDWVLADSNRNTTAIRSNASTKIGYSTDGWAKATSVTAPSPTGVDPDPLRPKRTYAYVAPDQATVAVAGMTPPQGFYGKFQWDGGGRTILSTDPSGIQTSTDYTFGDNVKYTKNGATGRQSTTFYDLDERVTDVYGPAPESCFETNSASGNFRKPRLPGDSQYCASQPVAHSSTEYDTGLPGGPNGLSATFWNNPNFTTNTAAGNLSTHEYFQGAAGVLNWSFGPAAPAHMPGNDWTARLTGRVAMTAGTNYWFGEAVDDGVRVYVDDKLVFSHWPGETDYSISYNSGPANRPNNVASHRIRFDYREVTGDATINAKWGTTPGALTTIPMNVLTPNFGLVSKTQSDDSNPNSPAKVNTTQYVNPADGLATSTVEDPGTGKLSLLSSVAYETPGIGKYMRRTSRTLPGGNQFNYSYYRGGEAGDTNPNPRDVVNPCTGGDPVNQGGALMKTTGPGPNGGPGQTDESVYDVAGRVVATRTNDETAWTCLTYDARGRVLTKTIPPGSTPQRVITYSYASGSSPSPLVTSVTDTAGTTPPTSTTITTETDLLGRVKVYTDAHGKMTNYTYDQAGRQMTTDSPGTQDARSTTYDSSGRIASQSAGANLGSLSTVATATYDGASQLTGVTYPGNGTYSVIERDQAGRTNKISYFKSGSNALITSDEVAYSQSSRVVNQVIDGVDAAPGVDNFQYDAAGRLTRASVTGHTYDYGFSDPTGCASGNNTLANRNSNRTTLTDNGVLKASYCYDNADRLTSTTDTRYAGVPTYDSHGNLTALGDSAMTYDNADRHMGTTATGGTSVTYERDALDRIIKRTGTSTTASGSGGGSGTPAGIAFRASSVANNGDNASTTVTVNRPAGTQTGDFLLAHVAVSAGSSTTVNTPSGWNALWSGTQGDSVRTATFWKWAAAADPSSFTFTTSTSKTFAVSLLSYSGVDATNPITQHWIDSSGSATTSHSVLGITTTAANSMAIALVASRGCSAAAPDSGWTERSETCSTWGYAETHTSEKLIPTAGVVPNANPTTATAAWHATQMVALKPSTTSSGGGGTTSVKVNFGPQGGTTPAGYSADYGQAFDTTRGYGWQDAATGVATSLVGNGRERWVQADKRLDTYMHMQLGASSSGVHTVGKWEAVVPNGSYNVTVGVGDPSYIDSRHVVRAEGTTVVDHTPTTSSYNTMATVLVNVTDGRMTLDATGGTNTKIDFVDIVSVPTTTTTTITKYSYSGDGDTAEAVLDDAGAVVDKTISLLGGVMQSVKYAAGVGTSKWQYPNIHGDIAAQADATGAKLGLDGTTANPVTIKYEPFGTSLSATPGNASTTTPDNMTSNFDYGWLGQQQRPTEHEGTLNTIEMGARQYLPGLGRFLQADPVEGASSNDYDYCDADPINCTDLDGLWPSFKKLAQRVARVASFVSIVPGPLGQASAAIAVVGYAASGDYKAAASAAVGIVPGGGIAAKSVKAGKVAKKGSAAKSCVRRPNQNSFTAETPVLMADGSEMPISQVKVGDMVLAADPETGEFGPRRVERLVIHSGVHDMVRLTLADGSTIEATDQHPFWSVGTSEFADAKDLSVGDRVLAASGETLSVAALSGYEDDVFAYNLTIDDIHTYFAGDTPVLVHNTCSPSESPVWKGLKNHRNSIKTNGQPGKKRRYYSWDHTHGEIEVFDKTGRHIGVDHPKTGARVKPAVTGRNIKDQL